MSLKNLFNNKTKKTEKGQTSNVNSLGSLMRIEDDLEQVFKKFDVHGNGKISLLELGLMMGNMGHHLTHEELENMIMEVDADGDGFISLKEFIELNMKGDGSTELLENLKDAFSVFDVDKNGLITTDELQKVLGSLGEECTIKECRKMIAGVDHDGDGMINFNEFKVMMVNRSSTI